MKLCTNKLHKEIRPWHLGSGATAAKIQHIRPNHGKKVERRLRVKKSRDLIPADLALPTNSNGVHFKD